MPTLLHPQQAEVPEYSYCSSPHVCTTHATTFEDSTKCICVCAVRDMAAQLSCNKVVQRLPSANHACILWLATPSRVSPPIGIITLAPLSGHIAHPEPNNISSRPPPPTNTPSDSHLSPLHDISCDNDASHKIVRHEVVALRMQLPLLQTPSIQPVLAHK